MEIKGFLIAVMLLFVSAASVWAYKKAPFAKSLRKLAGQGDAEAQSRLGSMYYQGQGVPPDQVQAHKWLTLATITFTNKPERDQAIKVRNSVATQMTPAQIAEAQKVAREWKRP
jgi:TPR repeat protein